MKVQGQVGMDETLLEDAEFEAALEARYAAAEALVEPRAAYRLADEVAKAQVKAKVGIGDVVRVGRFRIERKQTEARHVEFDAEAVSIKADGDD